MTLLYIIGTLGIIGFIVGKSTEADQKKSKLNNYDKLVLTKLKRIQLNIESTIETMISGNKSFGHIRFDFNRSTREDNELLKSVLDKYKDDLIKQYESKGFKLNIVFDPVGGPFFTETYHVVVSK